MARPTEGYHTEAGMRVPGASTIAGMIDDPEGLIHWGNTQGLGEPVSSLILADAMASTSHDVPATLELAKRALAQLGPLRRNGKTVREARQKVMNAGTLIHDCIEAWLHDNPQPPIPSEYQQAVDRGFNGFVDWCQHETRIEPMEIETSRVSEEHGYGGTIDLLATDPLGRIGVVDWKTGSGSTVYPGQLLQVTAYGRLLQEIDGIHVDWYGVHKIDRENGNFFPHRYSAETLKPCWEAFLLCRQAYELRRQIRRIA